jgi:hypothetical protein
MPVLWILPNRAGALGIGRTLLFTSVSAWTTHLFRWAPFHRAAQYWYQVGCSLDAFHRIPVRQNIKLGNAEGANQDPLLLSSVQPGISHSKLGGIPDAKEIPVVRVLPESPLSGSHLPRCGLSLGVADRLGRLRDRGAGGAANAVGVDAIWLGGFRRTR